MAVLELLAAAAWTWIVRTRHVLGTVWSAVHLVSSLAGILVGCCLLCCALSIDIHLALYVVLLGVLPVSYTHLDVYKRQG